MTNKIRQGGVFVDVDSGGGGAVVPPTNFLAPTGASFETFQRSAQVNSSGTVNGGYIQMVAIALPAGLSVGHVCFTSSSTAAVTPTHWWFGLYDQDRVQLATTADQESAAWAASTAKSLAIATTAAGSSASFTTTYTGMYYLGIVMTAATPITVSVSLCASGISGQPPILAGACSSGQTTPPAFPFTAGAISSSTSIPYAWVGA